MFHVITFQLMSFHAENICIKMLKINFLEITSGSGWPGFLNYKLLKIKEKY